MGIIIIRFLLTISIILVLSVPSFGQLNSWQDMLERADSLVNVEQFDSAVTIGQQILSQVQKINQIDDSTYSEMLFRVAEYYYNAEDYTNAESLFISSLELRKQIFQKDHLAIAESEIGLANIYNLRGMNEKASPLYHHALTVQINTLGEDNDIVFNSMSLMAQHKKNCDDFASAEFYYKKTLTLTEKKYGSTHPYLISPLNKLAYHSIHQKKFDVAEKLFLRALDIASKLEGDNCFRCLTIKINISKIYELTGRIEESIQLLTQLLSLIKETIGINHYYYGICQTKLGNLYVSQGNYGEAEKLFNKSINILSDKEGLESHNLALAKVSLANLYINLGKFSEAEYLYKDAITIIEKAFWYWNNTDYIRDPLYRLASLYLLQGRLDESEDLLNHMMDIFNKRYETQSIKIPECMINISYTYEKQKRIIEAEAICRKALKIHINNFGLNNRETSNIILRLAYLCQLQEDYIESENLYRQAINIREFIFNPKHFQTAEAIRSLASCYTSQNKYDYALPLLNEALAIFEKSYPENHPDIAVTISDIANIYMNTQRINDAIPLFEKSLTIYSTLYNLSHPEVGKNRLKLAKLYTSTNNFEKSIQYYKSYQNSRRELLKYLFISCSEEQKLNWISTYPPIDNSLLTIASTSNNPSLIELAFKMIVEGKSTVVDAVMAERTTANCSTNNTIKQNMKNLGQLSSIIANLVTTELINSQAILLPDSLQKLFKMRDSLEAKISLDCSNLMDFIPIKKIEIDNISQSLPLDGILWEFIKITPHQFDIKSKDSLEIGDRYLSFILKQNGDINLIDLGSANKIDSLIYIFRQMMYEAADYIAPEILAEHEKLLKKVLKELSNTIFEPCLPYLNKINHLIISPDDVLNLLPFEILLNKDESYLIEKFTISYIFSGRDIIATEHNTNNQKNIVIFADPDFDSSPNILQQKPIISESIYNTNIFKNDCLMGRVSRLKKSREEADNIIKIIDNFKSYNTIKYFGKTATEDNLKALNVVPSILHIATHGYTCRANTSSQTSIIKNSMFNSGLIFTGANQTLVKNDNVNATLNENGILTAYEASGLNLVGTKLVVLSACETGLGKAVSGEGIFGLRRAFRHAGAQNILLSLWQVPDIETSMLITEFYSKWLNGLSMHQALRESSLKLLKNLRRNDHHGHPLLWSGFIIAGKPD